ncbi:hypothetical protein TKK_0011283 [Trichogramma kaykai]
MSNFHSHTYQVPTKQFLGLPGEELGLYGPYDPAAAEAGTGMQIAGSHEYIYLPNERKCYQCLKCASRFSQKTTITRHLRYFCGKGYRYKCPYCHMLASCSSNIYRHVRSRHFDKKPHAIKLFSSVCKRTRSGDIEH